MSTRLTGARGLTAVAVAAAMSSVLQVRADIVIWYDSTTHFGFDVTHVPDLDQRRETQEDPPIPGLPNDGEMYCVPTASVNYVGYLANHGRDTIVPGPLTWSDAGTYQTATFIIAVMGAAMSTNSVGGTDGDGMMTGLSEWLKNHPFVLSDYWPTYSWHPTVETAMKEGMTGGLVLLAVGWYDLSAGILYRDGGHVISLVSGELDQGTWEIGFRDPWSFDGKTSQSPFATQFHATQNDPRTLTYGVQRTVSKVVGYDNGYIDGLLAIHPMWVISHHPDLNVLKMRYPLPPDGWLLEPLKEFVLPTPSRVHNLVRRPGSKILYLTEAGEGPAEVRQVDLVTGADVEIDPGPVSEPLQMMQGPLGIMYFVDGLELVRLDLDADPPFELHRIPLPAEVTALDYDDVNDMVMLYSAPSHGLLRYPYHLDAEVEAWDLVGIPHEEAMSFCWNDADQSGWFGSASSPTVWRVAIDPNTQALEMSDVPVPGLGVPADRLAPGDAGRMYVVANGRVVELVPGEGEWLVPEERWFAEVELGDGPVLFARNYSTWDESWQIGPEWEHRPPTGSEPDRIVIDCDADTNGNRVVDVDDLVAVLLAWGQEGYRGFIPEDVNQDGVINVDDLLPVILDWGECD